MHLQSIMSMQIVVVLMVVHPVAVWMAGADVLIVTGSDKACHIWQYTLIRLLRHDWDRDVPAFISHIFTCISVTGCTELNMNFIVESTLRWDRYSKHNQIKNLAELVSFRLLLWGSLAWFINIHIYLHLVASAKGW